MNNLQALKALKDSAKEQNSALENTIKEIHKQNLQTLSSDLMNTMQKNLNRIEKNIQSKNKTTLENIDYELELLRTNKIRKYILVSITSLIAGLIIGAILLKTFYPWIIPVDMRYTHENGSKWIKVVKSVKKDKTRYVLLEK